MRADRRPLDAPAIRRELDAFLTQPVATAPGRRTHVFERAVVQRFQDLFRTNDGTVPLLSRRVVLGLTYAMTRLLGSDRYRVHAEAAEAIAVSLRPEGDAGPEALADLRMERLVHKCLIDLAGRFDAFPRQLAEWVRLINSRLAAPRPDGWDAHWTLERRAALEMLQALYADLRQEMREPPQVAARYGATAVDRLDTFLSDLDQAMRLADRPWLLKPIG